MLRRAALSSSLLRQDAARALLTSRRWNQQAAAGSNTLDSNDHLRRRLLYRSKQRGWLEMDIMLGDWAAANLQNLDEPALRQFQEIVDMENPDLYRWLTGQDEVPDEVNNPLLRTLCNDLRGSMEPNLSVSSTASFAGKVWE